MLTQVGVLGHRRKQVLIQTARMADTVVYIDSRFTRSRPAVET